jgi:hypothetical protein
LEALELRRWRRSFTIRLAGVAELADALDSKSSDRKIVWVRAPPPAIPPAQQFEKHRPVFGAATGALLSVEVSRQNLGSKLAPNLFCFTATNKKIIKKMGA